MSEVTNEATIKAWGNAPLEKAEQFGDEGDTTRQYMLNPALFALLGDVNGQHILDAGCGQGYLCRLLAKRGATMTGIEPAETWYTYAQKREQDEPLGIQYLQAVDPNIVREKFVPLSWASGSSQKRLLHFQCSTQLYRFFPLNVGIYREEYQTRICIKMTYLAILTVRQSCNISIPMRFLPPGV